MSFVVMRRTGVRIPFLQVSIGRPFWAHGRAWIRTSRSGASELRDSDSILGNVCSFDLDPVDAWVEAMTVEPSQRSSPDIVTDLEARMHEAFDETRDLYLDVVRYNRDNDLYFVAMRREDGRGVSEWQVSLDSSSLWPTEVAGDFHESEFPIQIYRRKRG